MEKFYKTYSIRFDIGTLDFKRKTPIEINETIYVTYPITAEFAIGRSISTGTNSAIVTLYNLDENKRRLLYKDSTDIGTYIMMTISAGHDGQGCDIYRGSIDSCYSIRNGGETEYKTVIDSRDAMLDMYLGKTTQSFDAITKTPTRLEQMATSLVDLVFGDELKNGTAISQNIEFSESERGTNNTGKTLKMLRETSYDKDGNQTMSIDLGRIYFLDQRKDIVESFGVLEIDCDKGMLGSPRRRNEHISVEMLFEPEARLNQLAVLTSTTVPWLNQAYKIMGVSHNGIISGSKDGALTTTLDLFTGFVEWQYV